MKLSIITINRNNAAGLRKTMKSVFSQTYRDFEYIVVDGASTDESVEVVKEIEKSQITNHQSQISFTWISEPDTGIYNAMNKGIEIASGLRFVNALNRSELVEDKNKEIEIAEGKRVVDTFNRSTLCGDKNKEINRSELVEDKHGEADQPKQSGVENKGNEDGYVLMLNSGDYLVDDQVLERIIPQLDGTDIIQGNTIEEREGKTFRNRGYGRSEISMYDVMEGVFLHQASFCRISLFEKYGYFDETYAIAADTKFFIICLGTHNATFRYVNTDITNYDCTGISAEKSGYWYGKHWEESTRLRRELFSPRLERYLRENEPKVQLYNKLHEYKWIWNITMVLVYFHNWIYGNKKNTIIEKIQ